MIIRRALPVDRDVLVDIWLQSVRATHTFLTEEDIQSMLPLVREVALPELELWVLCTAGGAAVGFLGMSGAKIEALFLSPQYLRRGGGRMLVAHARKLKGTLTVDVNEQNPEALRFYEACGFEVAGRSELDSAGRPFPLLHLREVADANRNRPPPVSVRSRTIAAHRRSFDRAPRVRADDAVRRVRDDEENPGWFFGVGPCGLEGYFPSRWFAMEPNGVTARALRDYDAMELTIEANVPVECLAEESGWLLVRLEDGQEGWIPAGCLS